MIRAGSQPSQDTAALRVGVYVCQCGGNISDVVDTQQVAETVKLIPDVAVSRVHPFMCSEPGQAMMADEIRSMGLNRVVVASCSPFLHELTFRTAVQRGGLNPYLYEHVNIREQVSWVHHSHPAGATAKAIRLVAAAVQRLRHVEPLEQIRLPNHRRALVIGGGIAGLKAAGDLAATGLAVLLVEQGQELGGRVTPLSKLFPSGEDAAALVQRLIEDVRNNPHVEILTGTAVKGVSGFLGNYDVTLGSRLGRAAMRGDHEPGGARLLPSPPAENGEPARRQPRPTRFMGSPPGLPCDPVERRVAVGAIIVATGHEVYRPADGEYGFRQHPQVITMPDFIALLGRTSGDTLTWEGRPVRRLGFMHCVGSRQLEGVHPPQADGRVNDYCSRVCCTTTLHQAVEARRRFPGLAVFDFHQDIRTYGRGHEDYYRQASRAGVVFFRFHGDEPPVVESGTNGTPLQVRLKDWLSWGEEVVAPLDLLVLAVGLTPRDNQELIRLLKLPTGADRFLQEVHPKLRPVETAVNGILLAGTAQAPMTVDETLASAATAAAKAAVLLAHDEVELEPFKARVDAGKCIGCGLCFAECAYEGALVREEDDGDAQRRVRAKVNPGSCVGCGACVPVCPTRAIDLQGWTLEQFEAMVDGLLSPPTPVPSSAAREMVSHGDTH